MLPAAVVIGALSARLIARLGPPALLMAGLAPMAAGFALLTGLPAAGSYPCTCSPRL